VTIHLTKDDPLYPQRILDKPDPPPVTLTRLLEARGPVVAIVGSRHPLPEAESYARALAHDLAKAGATIVSGGAAGVDRAAHEGAMDAGGATWVVLPCGADYEFPPENADLFARVRADERSALLFPFGHDVRVDKDTPRARNAVLVALADAVVVVQAHLKSGSRNAMGWAESLKRPLWVVIAAPWMGGFCGSIAAVAHGVAKPLHYRAELFDSLRLPAPTVEEERAWRMAVRGHGRRSREAQPDKKRRPRSTPPAALPDPSWSQDEIAVFTKTSDAPSHVDEMVRRTGLGVGRTITALLTLSAKNVVVEGPQGFFRRRSAG
jgi:DNA processing protein